MPPPHQLAAQATVALVLVLLLLLVGSASAQRGPDFFGNNRTIQVCTSGAPSWRQPWRAALQLWGPHCCWFPGTASCALPTVVAAPFPASLPPADYAPISFCTDREPAQYSGYDIAVFRWVGLGSFGT